MTPLFSEAPALFLLLIFVVFLFTQLLFLSTLSQFLQNQYVGANLSKTAKPSSSSPAPEAQSTACTYLLFS